MQGANLKEIIINYLKKDWSLEQITGRLKQKNGYKVISHEMIYTYIYDSRASNERLYLHLSRECKPRVKAKRSRLIMTLTVDNDGEFARHESITKVLNIDIFFYKPYASEKWTLENVNRQLQRNLPREAMIDGYTQEQIDTIVNKINNRPIKILGFEMPAEVLPNVMEKY